MSGVATPNLPTFYKAPDRSAEVTGADWAGGLNTGGSCAPGVGINTGDYDPKVSDWSQDARDAQESELIGGTQKGPITAVQGADVNDQLSFVQATGDTAPDAEIVAGVVNRTGKTIPNGSWAWGTKTIA